MVFKQDDPIDGRCDRMRIGALEINWWSKKKLILEELKTSKINAIKKAKELHGWGLSEAYKYVNKLEDKLKG